MYMLNDISGQKIPHIDSHIMKDGSWKDVSSTLFFQNKTVVLFALPGAFTPTCSSSHVPRYNELYQAFKDNGVDDIICLSVNDTFVINAWAKDQKSDNIFFLPDGNGSFSEKMGMLVDKTNLGFGKRSWRYAMLVKDGIIEKMFIEPNVEGDPFEVSDADTMLNYINPHANLPKEITLFTKSGCPHCARAKKLLKERGCIFEEITIGENVSMRSLRAITGKETVPQIYISGKHIGGADELDQLL